MARKERLQMPVVSAGAEYLVMGYLMRRNILTYKAPPNNEGYDLICIHPDPRHQPGQDERAQVRVQVKSRYQTDCSPHLILREGSLGAFDYLIVAFLNIGRFYRGSTGLVGQADPEFYTLPQDFVWQHHTKGSGWPKLSLRGLQEQIRQYRNDAGFEQIAQALGIPRPQRVC